MDGIPLDGAALLKSAMMRGIPGAADHTPDHGANDNSRDSEYDDDIDGIPCKLRKGKRKIETSFNFFYVLQWTKILTVFRWRKCHRVH